LLSNYSKIIKPVIVTCLISLLVSCGFRLRGDVETPPQLKNVYIAGVAEYAELNQELRRTLLRSGSVITASEGSAESIIRITNEVMKKRVLSVDAQGRAAEYELNYIFSFTVVSGSVDAGSIVIGNETTVTNKSGQAKGKEPADNILVPAQEVNLTRDFRFDPDNVLATDAQEKKIRLDMVRFAVSQMLRRIRSHLKHSEQQ